MAAFVTERWSDRRSTRTKETWTAQRGFDVTFGVGDSPTEEQVLAVVPAINDAHPDNARLLAMEPDVKRLGFGLYRVLVKYQIPADGYQHYGEGAVSDPLLVPPVYRWTMGTVSLPVDKDIHNNPILNSAGFPLQGTVNRDFPVPTLVITRNEPYYDIQTAIAYAFSVNSTQFTIPGAGYVDPGQSMCHSIQPAGEFTPSAGFVKIQYTFEFRDTNRPPFGFKLRLLDQTTAAFYTGLDSAQHVGQFFDSTGKRVHAPVLLKGDGRPIQSDYKVGDGINSFTCTAQTLPSGVTADTSGLVGGKGAVFLLYDIHKQQDFNLLGWF